MECRGLINLTVQYSPQLILTAGMVISFSMQDQSIPCKPKATSKNSPWKQQGGLMCFSSENVVSVYVPYTHGTSNQPPYPYSIPVSNGLAQACQESMGTFNFSSNCAHWLLPLHIHGLLVYHFLCFLGMWILVVWLPCLVPAGGRNGRRVRELGAEGREQQGPATGPRRLAQRRPVVFSHQPNRTSKLHVWWKNIDRSGRLYITIVHDFHCIDTLILLSSVSCLGCSILHHNYFVLLEIVYLVVLG